MIGSLKIYVKKLMDKQNKYKFYNLMLFHKVIHVKKLWLLMICIKFTKEKDLDFQNQELHQIK